MAGEIERLRDKRKKISPAELCQWKTLMLKFQKAVVSIDASDEDVNGSLLSEASLQTTQRLGEIGIQGIFVGACHRCLKATGYLSFQID